MSPESIQFKMCCMLREIRMIKHCQQSEVEQNLNLPQGSVSKIERGKRKLEWHELYRLSLYYNVDLLRLCSQCYEADSDIIPRNSLFNSSKENNSVSALAVRVAEQANEYNHRK